VTARLFRHAADPDCFRAWLDYMETYLAVWVMGYEKGANLRSELTAPPGFSLKDDEKMAISNKENPNEPT
jgi:hypothetical protein